MTSPFGYTHPERDKREMCPFCKNEDTRRLVGLEHDMLKTYYQNTPYKVFECEACRGRFHFSLT
jgi:hypothetical protein